MTSDSVAWFDPVPGGRRFLIEHRPDGLPVGTVVFAPPQGAEMTGSRHLVARAAAAFAHAGWRVRRVDLKGCGDSSGEHGEAVWQDWVDDLRRVVPLAAEGPLCIWALRGGALLASAMALQLASGWSSTGRRIDWLLWQPLLSGHQALDRWLASQPPRGGARRDSVAATLRGQLAGGFAVTVGADTLHPQLAAGLDNARLDPPAAITGRIAWFESNSGEPPAPNSAARRAIDLLAQAGHDVTSYTLDLGELARGGAGGRDQERLIDASVAWLQDIARVARPEPAAGLPRAPLVGDPLSTGGAAIAGSLPA